MTRNQQVASMKIYYLVISCLFCIEHSLNIDQFYVLMVLHKSQCNACHEYMENMRICECSIEMNGKTIAHWIFYQMDSFHKLFIIRKPYDEVAAFSGQLGGL